jgi:hypothetical protein
MTLKRRTPTVCPQIFAPIMADDGNTYANQCLAQARGRTVVRALSHAEAGQLMNQQRWALGESLPLDAPGRSSAEKIALIVGFTGLALSAIGLGVGYWARHRKQKAAGLGYAKGNGERPLLKSGVVEHYDARMPIQMRVSLLQQLVYKSIHDPVMGPKLKKLALEITRDCPPNDPVCKTKAIYAFVKRSVRYTGDLAPIERSDGRYEAIDLFQSALKTLQYEGGDCLPAGTLLLVEGHRLVPIEQVQSGTRIWGREGWTMAQHVWAKGTLPVDLVTLNNGATFKATAEHKVYIALCPQHQFSCACPMAVRLVERMALAQVRPDMVMLTPTALTFGTKLLAPGEKTLLRIKQLTRAVERLPVFDITTEDHYVYLPEADVTVSNCDDHTVLNEVLLFFNDIRGQFKITAPTLSSDWGHIYSAPKINGQIIAIDTTLPGDRWGFEAPNGRHVEYPSYVAARS